MSFSSVVLLRSWQRTMGSYLSHVLKQTIKNYFQPWWNIGLIEKLVDNQIILQDTTSHIFCAAAKFIFIPLWLREYVEIQVTDLKILSYIAEQSLSVVCVFDRKLFLIWLVRFIFWFFHKIDNLIMSLSISLSGKKTLIFDCSCTS